MIRVIDVRRSWILGGVQPLVGLDGCHLKGKFGGHILSTTARDENDNIFPVILGVVEQENKVSWVWFLGGVQLTCRIRWLPFEGQVWWTYIISNCKG